MFVDVNDLPPRTEGKKYLTVLYNSTSVTATANVGSSPKVPFDTVIIDTDGQYDTSNKRIVIGSSGIYLVSYAVNYLTSGSGRLGRYIAELFKNGSLIYQTEFEVAVSQDQNRGILGTIYLNFSAGDYLEIFTLTTATADQTVPASTANGLSQFSVHKIA